MSVRGAAIPTPAARPSALAVYRDDGPLVHVLDATVGRALPLPASILVLLGVVPPAVVLALTGDGATEAAVGLSIAWLIVLAGAASARPQTDRLSWAVAPLLRVAEYGAILWIAGVAGATALPAAFALLAVVAFRQYDLVYRLRHRGTVPPPWVGVVSLGWEGRLVVAWLLLVAGALPVALYVWAGLLAIVLVGESVAGWLAFSRGDPAAASEFEDDEDAAA